MSAVIDEVVEEQFTACLSAKEVKALAKPEFAANPDKFYPTGTLKKLGFHRAQCQCGNNYWRYTEERQTCGDSNCEKQYTFIGRGTGRGNPKNPRYNPEKLTYAEAWSGFKRSLSSARVPCTPIKRYPVVARWRADVDYVAAGIFCFQPYCVTGELAPPANPLICPQFCLRFNDLDNIGLTGRHYSGFIMLGIQVFNKPNEYKFWMDECVEFNYRWLTEELGIDPNEITFIEDVWAGGGNLGPSIEYFVSGLELGNMVFMQYKTFPDGSREPLQVQVIDVGIGLERVPWLINGSPTSYCDVFPSAIAYLSQCLELSVQNGAWEKFGPLSCLLNVDEIGDIEQVWSYIAQQAGYENPDILKAAIEPIKDLYVLCDHTRCVLLAIQDGSLPSNVGGGQNVRRSLRRVFSVMKKRGWWDKIGMEGLFQLFECHRQDLAQIYGPFEPYPSFEPIVRLEYERWTTTDEEQRDKLNKILSKRKDKTLTLEDWIVCVTSFGISEDAVTEITNQAVPGNLWHEINLRKEKMTKVQPAVLYNTAHLKETLCLYYDNHKQYNFTAHILEVMFNVTDQHKPNMVVLDQTSFYPTSGGQEHDTGKLTIRGEVYDVVDCIKVGPCVLHILDRPLSGDVNTYKGEAVSGLVDAARRAILRNHHTATHIVYASCRRVLGPHVWQHGAKKSTLQAHLDITHYQSLTHEQVVAIQAMANAIVVESRQINKGFMAKDEAEGKYGFHLYQGGVVPGNELRVVNIVETDTEACCGTHADNTSEVGFIKILKTSRISDGIVRLYYVANQRALEFVNKESELLHCLTNSWSVAQDELMQTANKFFEGYKKYSTLATRQSLQIIELQVKCHLADANTQNLIIKSSESNASSYITIMGAYAARLQQANKSIVFVGDNFIYALLANKSMLDPHKELMPFIEQQIQKEATEKAAKQEREYKHRKQDSTASGTEATTTTATQDRKVSKPQIVAKDTIAADKGKDKKTGKKVTEKVSGILELRVFNCNIQQQAILDFFKQKGFNLEGEY